MQWRCRAAACAAQTDLIPAQLQAVFTRQDSGVTTHPHDAARFVAGLGMSRARSPLALLAIHFLRSILTLADTACRRYPVRITSLAHGHSSHLERSTPMLKRLSSLVGPVTTRWPCTAPCQPYALAPCIASSMFPLATALRQALTRCALIVKTAALSKSQQ